LVNRRASQELIDTIGKQKYEEPGVEAELNFEFFEFYQITSFLKRYWHRSSLLCYVMLRYDDVILGLFVISEHLMCLFAVQLAALNSAPVEKPAADTTKSELLPNDR